MYNANYMDDVPVKIAEKYKPPPPIYKLPQTLANKINVEENFYWSSPYFSYNLELEKKTLLKIEQWKLVRQRNKEQRKERISRKEHERKREYEDRQKNLLNGVSYPSTDDLSSDEEEDKIALNSEVKENNVGISSSVRIEKTKNSFHNILQPTVLSPRSNTTADNTQPHKNKSTFESKILNPLNYKDFEDDTSSPFDNIELKTINDLDVLAQVLHNSQIKSPCTVIETDKLSDNSDQNTKCNWGNVITENIPEHRRNLPRFNYDLNSPQENSIPFSDHHLYIASSMQNKNSLPHSTLTTYISKEINNVNGCYNFQSTNRIDTVSPQQYDGQKIDETKSKSVPDILIELRNEIKKSEIRRQRNCSCNTEDSCQHIDPCLTNKWEDGLNCADKADLIDKFDSKAERLVKHVTAMGFPLERVARIVQLLGADDKKVVEHLIPLSELADLGFEESKISDALMRNENNKNKALDELIS